jgi:nicotinate-nucleotide--dimethylbenzimidazole phosphoribosyltransferase
MKEEKMMLDEKMLKAQLFQQLCMIGEPSQKQMDMAWQRWDSIGKPLRSLGLLEKAVVRMAGMQGSADVKMDKKAIVVMCADHGVVAEGVTQTGSEVTRIVAENLTQGRTSVNIMAARAGADVFSVDMGIKGEAYPDGPLQPGVMYNCKLGQGTGNIAVEPAMTPAACVQALLSGIRIVGELSAQGYQIIGIGEMGIGNTTASSALVSVLLNLPVEEVTGRGAGLSDEGLQKKVAVIEKAVNRYWEATEASEIAEGTFFRAEAGIELLSHLGGYEIVGMAGICLGGAIYGVPIVLDGYISAAAALCASLISSESTGWMLASHVSAEPAGRKVLRHLHLEPVIDAGMCLGEGTGAAAAISLYEMGLAVYNDMRTFDEIHVEQYEHFQ